MAKIVTTTMSSASVKAENFFLLVRFTTRKIFRDTESEISRTGMKLRYGLTRRIIKRNSRKFKTNGIYEIPPLRIMSANSP